MEDLFLRDENLALFIERFKKEFRIGLEIDENQAGTSGAGYGKDDGGDGGKNTGDKDEIYSTVDACNTAKEMWTAIERLQQGESLNVQDVKTNLFWEFGKFTSRDGESMESYYSRFYKLMNELTRNNLQVSQMQVNVQFLQQLQPEWSRFVTIVKQKEEIDTVSYHRLFDVLKQFQNEVNDIRSERLARSANPLALLAAAQPYSDNYYQAPKPQRSNAPSYMQSSSIRPSATTRHKGKEIAKPVTPQSESVSEEDSDPEQARRDKDKKGTGTHLLSISELYKTYQQHPSTLQTIGTRLRYPHPAEQVFHFKSEQEKTDWLEDTDEEIDEQELEAHYSYMAKIQEVSPEETSSTSQPLEQELMDNQLIKMQAECVDERAALCCNPRESEYNLLQHPYDISWHQIPTIQEIQELLLRSCMRITNQEWNGGSLRDVHKVIQDTKAALGPKKIWLHICPMFIVLYSLADCYNSSYFIVDSGCTKAHDGQSQAFVSVINVRTAEARILEQDTPCYFKEEGIESSNFPLLNT
ncbi:hypothetical protein Tco_0732234 [Tanacetum coccineum]